MGLKIPYILYYTPYALHPGFYTIFICLAGALAYSLIDE